MTKERDIPPDAGTPPPFDPADRASPRPDTCDPNDFGEEYDSAAEKRWRAEQTGKEVAPEGAVTGSGAGAGGRNRGEDYETDPASGGDNPPIPD